MKILNLFLFVLISLSFAGCGASRQKQREAEIQKAKQMLADSTEECRRNFPDEIKQAISRASCINQAMLIIRPMLPYPDLLDQENATRLGLAEKVQTGKMTPIERDVQFSHLHSQLVAEEQRRNLASRSVSASESAAAAAWQASAPVSCTKIGNTVNCF